MLESILPEFHRYLAIYTFQLQDDWDKVLIVRPLLIYEYKFKICIFMLRFFGIRHCCGS
jgi:hypothetical protein